MKTRSVSQSLSLSGPAVLLLGIAALGIGPMLVTAQDEHRAGGTTASSQPAAASVAPATASPSSSDRSGDPDPRREPSATAILRELTNRENAAAKPVVLPNRPNQVRPTILAPEAMPKNNVKPVQAKLYPDGYRLVDRSGRLTREGDYYVFSFESRGQATAEPPMRLLPNRLLEDMEEASEAGTKSIVFVVSGEVTEFHGVNYLLLQKLLTRPNLGNLK